MTEQTIPPGWYPDPTNKVEFRFWDGTQWTQQVSDGSVVPVDTGIATQKRPTPMLNQLIVPYVIVMVGILSAMNTGVWSIFIYGSLLCCFLVFGYLWYRMLAGKNVVLCKLTIFALSVTYVSSFIVLFVSPFIFADNGNAGGFRFFYKRYPSNAPGADDMRPIALICLCVWLLALLFLNIFIFLAIHSAKRKKTNLLTKL